MFFIHENKKIDSSKIYSQIFKSEKEKYKIIDLFAGIGGIRLGFENIFDKDCECVFTSEIDEKCNETYYNNFPKLKDMDNHNKDITKIDISTIHDHNILLAGFPCQSFSMAGNRLGFESASGTLFFEIVKIIKEKRPDIFLLENVKGLISHDGGNTLKTIKNILRNDLNYFVYSKVLDSQNFGLAQRRERIYIVGFREPRKFKFPDSFTDNITDLMLSKNKNFIISSSIKDILDEKPEKDLFLTKDYWANLKIRKTDKIKQNKGGFGYSVKKIDDCANTLVVGGSGENNLIIDDRFPTILGRNIENVRKLSPKECARLQGYPDSFILHSLKTHSYKQLGNSVAINVISSIAYSIKLYFEDEKMKIICDEKSLLIIKFMIAMFENDIFSITDVRSKNPSCRKTMKRILEIIDNECVVISDISIFFEELITIDLVKSYGDSFVQFNKELIILTDICDFVNFIENKIKIYEK